jgi:hypothetical protein
MALITCQDCGKEHSDQAASCPQCGRPNQVEAIPRQKEIESTAKQGGKAKGCLYGCASLIGLIAVLGVIGSLLPNSTTSDGTTTNTGSITDTAWVPKGYTQYDDNVAYRFRNSGEISCGYRDSCWQMELVSKNGCSSLYVELTRLGPNQENVGYTNDTTSNLAPGQKAVLTFSSFDDDKTAQLSKINCR